MLDFSDLAGIVSLRFNCSDQMTYQTTAQIFMGLAQACLEMKKDKHRIIKHIKHEALWQPVYFHSVLQCYASVAPFVEVGAWGCFDEFNRISIEASGTAEV